MPDLKKNFNGLKLQEGLDSKQRVVEIFQETERIIQENGLKKFPNKYINRIIVEAVRSKPPGEVIQNEINFSVRKSSILGKK